MSGFFVFIHKRSLITDQQTLRISTYKTLEGKLLKRT